uniref:Signal transducer and activator of transcription n=1 Tax=Arcella intermedia TaxID=1963864 RepID=A0A6B2KZR9_9EUKA
MNQMYINQPLNNQAIPNHPHLNQQHINQCLINQPNINQPLANQPIINQNHLNQGHINQLHLNQGHINQIHSFNQMSYSNIQGMPATYSAIPLTTNLVPPPTTPKHSQTPGFVIPNVTYLPTPTNNPNYPQPNLPSPPMLPSPQNPTPQFTPSPLTPSLSPSLEQSSAMGAHLLEQLQILQFIRKESEQLRWDQRQYLTPMAPQPQILNQLDQRQKRIRQEIEKSQSVLEQMLETILLPVELHKLSVLKNDLLLELKQLELFEFELQQYLQSNAINLGSLQRIVSSQHRIGASLVITKHPFPKSVQQHKPLESGITVKILTGANQSVWPCSPVKAEISYDQRTVSKKNSTPTQFKENNEKEMVDGSATFNDLVFPLGTRKKFIFVKFKVEVQMGPIKTTIESPLSEPIIVKTNENQWQESEGLLLQYEAFGNGQEVSWCRFANALQRRYIMATKQDRQNPVRPLSQQDLLYLYHAKFNPHGVPTQQTTITLKQFENFWQWFGAGLYRIRYQRHLCTLWVRGFICGFINRNEAENILENASPGTFILRFSEQCPGQFAIAYIPIDDNPGSNGPLGALGNVGTSGQGRVRHYLMQRDDIFGAKKTLADFLGSAKNFSQIVQIVDHPTQGRIFQQCDKNSNLSEFYSKRGSDNTFGYENRL